MNSRLLNCSNRIQSPQPGRNCRISNWRPTTRSKDGLHITSRPSPHDAEKHPASRMAAGSCAQIESLARAYERPALRKPFAAFPADTKVA
jgi:hypothetical protein